MWTVIGSFLSCLVCVATFLFSYTAIAEDTSFEATVSTNQISLQDALELTLTVHGAKANVSDVPMPVVDGFEIRYVGPADKFTFINGVTSNEHSFTYNLFPSKVGHFQIPAILIKLDGKEYSSKPIDIDVVDRPTAVASKLNDIEAKTQETIKDKVFIKATIDHPTVYVGEKTPLSMKVYVKDLSLQLAGAPALKPNGFLTDATCNMQKGHEVVNGMSYETLVFDTNIYPIHSGKITVGPFDAQGQLIFRVKQRNNDFLSDFFGIQQTQPITLTGEAINVEAIDLPKEGKPANFSGAVGQYDFKASIGPSTIKLGDPLTLRMTLSGQGRLKDISLPVLQEVSFKTYEPQIKETEDSKIVEQIIIPTDPNMKEIQALTFTYFDPQDKTYKTITQGPFPVGITPIAKTEEFKAYGFVDKSKAGEDKNVVLKLDGINKFSRGLVHQTQVLLTDWRFWLGITLIAMVWVCLILWQGFQRKLRNDPALARRFFASDQARKGIKKAEDLLKNKKEQEFYNMLNKVLENYLADKLHKPVGALNFQIIEKELNENKVQQQYLAMLKEIFEKCDAVRFAAGQTDQKRMQEDFLKLQQIIDYLDKKLKS